MTGLFDGADRRADRYTDRHDGLRREEDVETHTIVEHAVEDAPIVRRLLHTSKVAAAVGTIGALVGAVAVILGVRLVGPQADMATLTRVVSARADTNAARIERQNDRLDSLISVMAEMRQGIQTMTYIQCVALRRDNPDLRPPGCDVSGSRTR